MNIKEELKKEIATALEYSQKGKMAKAKDSLLKVYEIVKKEPALLWNDADVAKLGKIFIIMNHFDLFEDEDTNISIAHLAYFFLSRAFELEKSNIDTEGINNYSGPLFEILKDRIMIFENCDDSFTHSIAEFYKPKAKDFSPEELDKLHKYVNNKIPLLQYFDLMYIEKYDDELLDNSYLIEIANKIESEFGKEDLKEAQQLHEILFYYIKTKIFNHNFDF